MPHGLDDSEWSSLLRMIHHRQVIPVVGPSLVTVPSSNGGDPVPLHRALAPRLAEALGLPNSKRYEAWNDVARDHLLGGGDRQLVYESLREILDTLPADPPEALLSLAEISDFDLYISSTPDHLLVQALEQRRPGFRQEDGVLAFHPQGHSGRPEDLPHPLERQRGSDPDANPLAYYILGDLYTYPDFAVWEEDYMEFICGLLERSDTLENLFRVLKRRHLLFLGAPSQDWIVRFFLRVARGQRLSTRQERDYLADHHQDLGEAMVLFFDQAIRATRVIDGCPQDFVQELSRAWQERYRAPLSDEELLAQLPLTMPRDAVFLSYGRNDWSSALELARDLRAAGVPVWLDRQRLEGGENFSRSIEQAIKNDCSFFLSLISQDTESDPNRFVHQERKWAAGRHVDGFVFYLPLILDLPEGTDPKLEPEVFRKMHWRWWHERRDYVIRVRRLMDEYRQSGRPRG